MDDLLTAIYNWLMEADRPVHYKTEIFPAFAGAGWVTDDYAGEVYLYNAIYGDIRKHGENSRFRRSGRGYIIAFDCYDSELHAPAKANVTEANPQGHVRLTHLVPEICGTCKYLSFSGIGELHLDAGDCERSEDSGRLRCQATERRCPYWSRRSVAATEAIAERHFELHVLAIKVNYLAHREADRSRKR